MYYWDISDSDGNEERVGPATTWHAALAQYEELHPGLHYGVSDPIAPCPGTGKPVTAVMDGGCQLYLCPECGHVLSGRWYEEGDPAESHPPRRWTYLAIINVAEHSGRVVRDDVEAYGFRYADHTAPHGTVLCETYDRDEAERELASWLECDSAEQGTYCYTHNPYAGREVAS